MNNSLIWYTCALCRVEVKVLQLPDGCWLDKDLNGHGILVPDGERPPMPCHWVEFNGKHYCPNHELVFHGTAPGTRKAEHFYVFLGLSTVE